MKVRRITEHLTGTMEVTFDDHVSDDGTAVCGTCGVNLSSSDPNGYMCQCALKATEGANDLPI